MKLRLFTTILGLHLAFGAPLNAKADNESWSYTSNSPTDFELAVATDIRRNVKPYDVFVSGTMSDKANCWATMTMVKRQLEGTGLKTEFVTSGIKDPLNLFSLQHPSLLVKDPETGETLAITTTQERGKNAIITQSLGQNPSDNKIASYLMGWNNSIVLVMRDRVYMDRVAWEGWSDSISFDHCQSQHVMVAERNGILMFAVNDKNKDVFYVVPASAYNKNIQLYKRIMVERTAELGRIGDSTVQFKLKSMGMLAPGDAALGIALNAVFDPIHAKGLGDLITLLGSGAAVNQLGVSATDLGKVKGLSAGVTSYYSFNPNAPLSGFTQPKLYAEYQNKQVKAYVDQAGIAVAQYNSTLKRGTDGKIILSYNRQSGDTSAYVGGSQKLGRHTTINLGFVLNGLGAGTPEMPSELASPVMGGSPGRHSSGLSLGINTTF